MAGQGGYVTTHVLDLALGRPAEGLRIEIYRLDGERRIHLGSAVTNADGRTGGPVISGGDVAEAIYELVFFAGEYHERSHGAAAGVRFLNEVPIRFGLSDSQAHYHVPLLLSPYGYSTYRGS